MPNSNIDLVRALDKIRLGNLYVHNYEIPNIKFKTPKLKDRKVYLVETLASINALVDRGTMLLYGGHGGGKTTLTKYLGQLFYQISKDEIEDCILRGHPQLTEEKILGSLDIAQLTRAKELNNQKKVDVIWNTFVDSPWKIIDELNRLSPYAQNILLSLLAESSVKYHNESKRLPNFTLYATMNPKDEGNFIMSLPFLDRFALALPITMPDYESLSTIGKKDKSTKQDDLSTYLKDFDLRAVQDEIREMKYSDEAELFINVIYSSYRLCDRMPKEDNDSITVENTLCTGCHYDAPEKVCNKIIHPLSVRVKEDLYRYGKAIAWFLGDSEVKVEHIKTIAPYFIWHRSSVSKKYKKTLRESRFEQNLFSVNIELEATRELIKMIGEEFEGLKSLLKEFDKVKRGILSQVEFDNYLNQITQPNYNFIITKIDIIPILQNEYKPVYHEIIDFNLRIDRSKSLETLNQIKEELSYKYNIPNRQFLTDRIERERRKVGIQSMEKHTFIIPFENFINVVNKNCPELYKIIISRFHSEFNPAIRKEEMLSDIGEDEFTLKMEKVNKGGGQFNLIFSFLGNTNNPIYRFLKDKHVS